ncbi:MAG TPA: hypothetical protein VMT00_07685 [Thermoanaerobaculia bacterium]|nr:hypothetical protein [Thermoanaerobaculia bacterium]
MELEQGSCVGCGVTAVVRLNGRNLCGHCYYIAVSMHERPIPAESSDSADLERALVTAMDEIQKLQKRLDELTERLPAQREPAIRE